MNDMNRHRALPSTDAGSQIYQLLLLPHLQSRGNIQGPFVTRKMGFPLLRLLVSLIKTDSDRSSGTVLLEFERKKQGTLAGDFGGCWMEAE